MQELTVDPDYLNELAGFQDQASGQATSGAKATHKVSHDLWLTHGVISGVSNTEVSDAVNDRVAAGKAIAKACAALADSLRSAADAYQGTDEQESENLDNQLLDR